MANISSALATASLSGDVDAVRKLVELPDTNLNERDGGDGARTPLMVAALTGNLEIAWLLVDANADITLRDNGGASALDLARSRNHEEVIALLGGGHAEVQGPPPVPDFSSDEEETLKPVEKGHVVIIDHIVPSSADLSAFEWGRYERGLAKLAGVDQEKVFVSAEPGRTALELHATIVKRLNVLEATSPEGIEEVMATVKSVQRRDPLQKASGGAPLMGPTSVKLQGEAKEAEVAVFEQACELDCLRPQYETLRDDFEAALEINGGETRRLAAAKAILLLRPSRLAIEKAVAAGSKEQARRARRR